MITFIDLRFSVFSFIGSQLTLLSVTDFRDCLIRQCGIFLGLPMAQQNGYHNISKHVRKCSCHTDITKPRTTV